MTSTQRKSAPTAATVEGTKKPIQENDIITHQKYQDPTTGNLNSASLNRLVELGEKTLSRIRAIPVTDVKSLELKRLFRQYIIINRFIIRFLTTEISFLDTYIRQVKHVKRYINKPHQLNKLTTLVIQHEKRRDKLHEVLILIGENTASALDCWQLYGADYPELFELCGADFSKFVKLNGQDALLDIPSFGAAMFTYGIDYRGEGDFIEYDNDGPLTHAVLTYFRSLIGTTAFDKKCHTIFNDLMQKERE